MTDSCPHCHQPLRHVRLGICLPQRKAELFDSIKVTGDAGITSHELWVMHYVNEKRDAEMNVIKSHINQINDLLVETDFKIVADGRGKNARWMLVEGSGA